MMDGLPRLRGIPLVAYRTLWCALLTPAVAAAIAGQHVAWSPTAALEAAILLGASALLFRRRGADSIAAMLSIAFLLWVLTSSPFWDGIDTAAVPLAMLDRSRFLLFVGAMMLFPSGRFDPRWTRLAVGATFLAFGLGVAEALRLVPAGAHVVPAMTCAALAVAAMRARLASLPPGIERQQIKWVALGLGIGLGLVGLSRLGGLAADPSPVIAAFAQGAFDLGVTSMALGMLVSLLRYRLYDADAAISHSTTIAVLTLSLVGTFAGAEVVIQTASQHLLGDMAGTVSSAVAAALAAALIAPIHKWAEGWTERRFQPALAAFREEAPEMLADLRETVDLAMAGEIVLERIERATRASRSALLIRDAPVAARPVAATGMSFGAACQDRLFPHRVALELDGLGTFGWLLLGPRPDGSLLGKDEREAVAGIAGPLARAIFAVQRAAERERRLADLEGRLRMLEGARRRAG
ncbi:MAG: hypothetical protein ACT4N8_00395 [Sphingosinicella sp.]|uniref:hypothetical protein n=1 Tax=Sphingosinicella sp. TaxID=1917971 RepID=UPI0040378684